MSGVSIDPRLPCEECGSSDGVQLFQQEDGSVNARCFACPDGGRHIDYDPREKGAIPEAPPKRELKQDHTKLMKEVSGFPILALEDRGISQEVAEHYGVHVALSEEDGTTVTHHYYPDTKGGVVCGYEVRDCLNKKFTALGDRKGAVELWGTTQAKSAGGMKLFITEGRCDAMALFQCLKENTAKKWSHLTPSVVSLTRGAGGALKDILNNREFVDSYKEVILVLDGDEPGQDARDKVLKTFPHFKVVDLPLKDANDMLLAGRGKELFNLVMWNSEVKRQGQVVDVSDFIEEALIKPEHGVPTPWPGVTKLTYGFREHTIHIIGAAPKIGKSDHEYQCIEWLANTQNQLVGVFDLENPPKKTAKKVASKFAGLDYTKPDSVYETADLRAHLMQLDGRVRFYDRGASRDWSDIRVAMEEMHLLDGIKFFVLDPLTALVSRYTSSEANDKLNEICTDIADFVYKHPVTLLIYTHVNPKPKSSKPHEEGGRVLSGEFTGSRAMEKWFHYGWGIRRDRSPESEAPNTSYLDLLFDRDFGESGTVELFFDKGNMSYLEPRQSRRKL
jgi:twinkle protein